MSTTCTVIASAPIWFQGLAKALIDLMGKYTHRAAATDAAEAAPTADAYQGIGLPECADDGILRHHVLAILVDLIYDPEDLDYFQQHAFGPCLESFVRLGQARMAGPVHPMGQWNDPDADSTPFFHMLGYSLGLTLPIHTPMLHSVKVLFARRQQDIVAYMLNNHTRCSCCFTMHNVTLMHGLCISMLASL